MPRLTDLCFPIEGPRGHLVIHRSVLCHLDRHRQISRNAREAGGQLFATYERHTITIREATGPYSSDKRHRYLFAPDRAAERRDILRWFRTRKHFVGNWHTHPEQVPSPSFTDVQNTRARFIESEHELLAFTMIIVGLAPFPDGLWVSLIDATGHTVLRPRA